jgi:arylsulfatase A-like enzyme
LRDSCAHGARALCLGLAALAAAACGPQAAQAPPRATGPDVVVILIDTLRPDHLEAFGYPKATAPFLAELAQRSVVFRRAWSTSSWTAPATASLFTGLYPPRHGVTEGFRAQTGTGGRGGREVPPRSLELRAIPRSVATLPELLRGAGYATFGLSANVNVGSELGFDRGFDRFERLEKQSGHARALADAVLAWRQEMEARPYFLYLHFNDVHRPYDAREPWYEPDADETRDTISRYDSEIRYLDGELRRLYDTLGWERDTLLVVASDHGEGLMQRGKMGHWFSLNVELQHVLLLLRAPGLAPRDVQANASLVDVVPSVLDLLGLEPAQGRDGRSLLPLARAGASESPAPDFAERPVFGHRSGARFRWNRGKALWSVTRGRWKLIQDTGKDTLELFDLEQDPGELHDLSAAEPERVRALASELAEFQRAQAPADGDAVRVPLDEALTEELRALGYLDDGEEH